MENIIKIFNSKDETEIKQAFKEIIIEQFRNDIQENDRYLFNPDDISDMIQEAFLNATNEVKQEYKEKLKEKMLISVDKDFEKII